MEVIIKKPVISEKASAALAQNKYIFYVDKSANKIEIKKYVEVQFDVKVKDVNIANVKGKKRQRGKVIGYSKDRKKAIITLKAGSEIKKIKEIF
jgi:large subunit ribosomal protein L23